MITLQTLGAAIGRSLRLRHLDRVRAQKEAEETARRKAEAEAEAHRQADRAKRLAELRRFRASRKKPVVARAREEDLQATLAFRERQQRISSQTQARAEQLVREAIAARAAAEDAERIERDAMARQWAEERQRRKLFEIDADGSIAEAKRRRDEELEQERLDFLAAQLVRRAS